jgi:hypothetical protein
MRMIRPLRRNFPDWSNRGDQSVCHRRACELFNFFRFDFNFAKINPAGNVFLQMRHLRKRAHFPSGNLHFSLQKLCGLFRMV